MMMLPCVTRSREALKFCRGRTGTCNSIGICICISNMPEEGVNFRLLLFAACGIDSGLCDVLITGSVPYRVCVCVCVCVCDCVHGATQYGQLQQ